MIAKEEYKIGLFPTGMTISTAKISKFTYPKQDKSLYS